MNAQQREVLQIAILEVLDADPSRFGLGLDAVTLHVSRFGFPNIVRGAVEVELDYLAEKGLVETVGKVLEPANRAWKRTAAGRDFLSQRNNE